MLAKLVTVTGINTANALTVSACSVNPRNRNMENVPSLAFRTPTPELDYPYVLLTNFHCAVFYMFLTYIYDIESHRIVFI